VDESMAEGYRVYPNPTEGELFVADKAGVVYHIANVMGQTVLTGTLAADNESIDVSSLPAGMYFITIGQLTTKFIVNQ
ncbi:MAG: T9SS type A sorting domain-containing protein, partial [Bacteroidales bacterium]|nr:T9SS type A sorting domain-containing protein [Bacteroidales bacterium]